jgi:predicted house-cleaning noncanonical NTP pyrophosphatase (MazG superfamily)
MKVYNKLVRDKIPEIIQESGAKCTVHIANNEEYQVKLYEKVQEELLEFKHKPSLEEYIDIIEVLEALAQLHDIDLKSMRLRKRVKRNSRGGFEKRIILESTE